MKDHLFEFENYLKNEKNSSANTMQSYIRDLTQFSAYCSNFNFKDLADVNTDFINNYFNHLRSTGRSESTLTRAAASLRCYYKFLDKYGLGKDNPVSKLKQKAAPKKLPEILTNKEVLLLLEQPSGTDYKACRDKAMLELLYATGIKVSELIELKISDVNLHIGILHMHSGKNERIIPIYPEAIKVLTKYLNDVRPVVVMNSAEDRLFTNMTGGALSRQGFWKIVKHYAQLAKINKDITPHTLRHSFAAHLLENGAQLKDIKEMLGHSDISSTQIYAQLMKQKYAQAYKRFHPLAR